MPDSRSRVVSDAAPSFRTDDAHEDAARNAVQRRDKVVSTKPVREPSRPSNTLLEEQSLHEVTVQGRLPAICRSGSRIRTTMMRSDRVAMERRPRANVRFMLFTGSAARQASWT